MAREIAVFLGANGATTALQDEGKIVVYQKQQGSWVEHKTFALQLAEGLALRELRQCMDQLIDFLGECKVFVALCLNGVPYFALEKAGFSIWEFEGRPTDFLDYILSEEEAQEQANLQCTEQASKVIPLPVETTAGCFKLSLKEVQENNQGITSKQVLLPFLRKGKFYALEVLCNHVPPWLEAELATGGFTSSVERLDHHTVRVTISKQCCNQ